LRLYQANITQSESKPVENTEINGLLRFIIALIPSITIQFETVEDK